MAVDNFGYQALGEYAPVYAAAERRLKGSFADQRGGLAQSIAAKGLRTSGVSLLPSQVLEKGQSEAEAGLIGNFATQQAGTNIEDRRRAEGFAHQKEMADRGFDMQNTLQRRLAQQQTMGTIIGSGLGAVGTAAGAYYGGPMGAAAGGALGKRAGQQLTGDESPMMLR